MLTMFHSTWNGYLDSDSRWSARGENIISWDFENGLLLDFECFYMFLLLQLHARHRRLLDTILSLFFLVNIIYHDASKYCIYCPRVNWQSYGKSPFSMDIRPSTGPWMPLRSTEVNAWIPQPELIQRPAAGRPVFFSSRAPEFQSFFVW